MFEGMMKIEKKQNHNVIMVHVSDDHI